MIADLVGYLLRFGSINTGRIDQVDTWQFALCLPFAWLLVLAVGRAYEGKILGSGPAEYQRVLRAFWHVVALTTFALCALQIPASRGFILIALPGVLVLTWIGRHSARCVLRSRRRVGQAMKSVLAIGDAASLDDFAALLASDSSIGLRLVGACAPAGDLGVRNLDDTGTHIGEARIPLYGDTDSVAAAVRASGADVVAVVSNYIRAERLRWISWQLERTDAEVLVTPGLIEVAGRRLHIQQASGLPLLHVAQPTFQGASRLAKGVFDRLVAGMVLTLLAPLFLVIGTLVRFTSEGPAFFVQTRVGKDGRTFRMIKFRTMIQGAEQRVSELVERNESNGGVLFKMRNDPRVTRVGAILRKYSLDELPQLINVVQGTMSLVGPRPPLQHEVEQYADDHRRRLLVKPGLTGLWQISGRSDLSWEESVRLDLRYVENWSLATDLHILWRTVFAVLRSSGAY